MLIPDSHLERNGDGSQKYRVLELLRNRLRTLHYSKRTETIYCDWLRRFIIFHGRRHPATMGGAEIAAFLTDLAVNGKVSASTQNQARHALLFFIGGCSTARLTIWTALLRRKEGAAFRSCYQQVRFACCSVRCVTYRDYARR